jgi:hypothetical protein
MNDTHIEARNPVFQTVHELYDRKQYIRHLERYLSKNNHTKSVQGTQINIRYTQPRERHTQWGT